MTAQLGALRALARSWAVPAVGEPGTDGTAQQEESGATGTSREECT